MAEFRRVSVGDVGRFFHKRGQMDLTEYERFLAGQKPQEVGEASLEENETERAVKRRLTVAARIQGKRLQYSKRAPEGTVVFRVK
jgi:hypothetical protein